MASYPGIGQQNGSNDEPLHEDPPRLSAIGERRRTLNRIAQRRYRRRLQHRLNDLERRATVGAAAPKADSAEQSDGPDQTDWKDIQDLEDPTHQSSTYHRNQWSCSPPPYPWPPTYDMYERPRGRTPERDTGSRRASASPATRMIDERMEWAQRERSNSCARDEPAPPSPFRESSPYHSGLESRRHSHADVMGSASPAELTNDHIWSSSAALLAGLDTPSTWAEAVTNGQHRDHYLTAKSEYRTLTETECQTTTGIIPPALSDPSGTHRCTNRMFTGNTCNRLFPSAYNLAEHKSRVHDGKVAEASCSLCSQTFLTPLIRARHRRVMHPETDESEEAKRRGRGQEVQRKGQGNEGILACPQASAVHEMQHQHPFESRASDEPQVPVSDEVAGPVEACSGSFSEGVVDQFARCLQTSSTTASSVNHDTELISEVTGTHRAATEVTHDPSSHVAIVADDDCRGSLVRSFHGQAGEELPTHGQSDAATCPQDDRHTCMICSKAFSRRSILENHRRTHTGETPFECDVLGCGMKFRQRNEQRRHQQTMHGGLKRFVCGEFTKGRKWGCGKRFARKDGLLEHQQRTEKGKQCWADRPA